MIQGSHDGSELSPCPMAWQSRKPDSNTMPLTTGTRSSSGAPLRSHSVWPNRAESYSAGSAIPQLRSADERNSMPKARSILERFYDDDAFAHMSFPLQHKSYPPRTLHQRSSSRLPIREQVEMLLGGHRTMLGAFAQRQPIHFVPASVSPAHTHLSLHRSRFYILLIFSFYIYDPASQHQAPRRSF